MADQLPSGIIAGISFIGRGGGLVKTLGGFRKGHHTLPDAANAVTNAFLGKIAEGELAAQAEQLFQEVKAALGYKRKDLALSVSSPVAMLTARDFTVELTYALEDAAPSAYTVTTVLRGLKSADLVRTPEFEGVFEGKFTEISFELKRGARVEAMIDVIEALDAGTGLAVTYPSDCRECVIRVEGVAATVRCTGATLEMIFPTAGSPAELMDAFGEVRAAFQVRPELADLLG